MNVIKSSSNSLQTIIHYLFQTKKNIYYSQTFVRNEIQETINFILNMDFIKKQIDNLKTIDVNSFIIKENISLSNDIFNHILNINISHNLYLKSKTEILDFSSYDNNIIENVKLFIKGEINDLLYKNCLDYIFIFPKQDFYKNKLKELCFVLGNNSREIYKSIFKENIESNLLEDHKFINFIEDDLTEEFNLKKNILSVDCLNKFESFIINYRTIFLYNFLEIYSILYISTYFDTYLKNIYLCNYIKVADFYKMTKNIVNLNSNVYYLLNKDLEILKSIDYNNKIYINIKESPKCVLILIFLYILNYV